MKRIIKRSTKISYDLFESAPQIFKFNHFAFIWHKNKLVSIGKNDPVSTHRKALYFGERYNIEKFKRWPFIHAEISAVSKCWGRCVLDKSYSLVVIRIDKNGKLNNSQPCKNCSQILEAIGITKIYWSEDNGEFKSRPD